VPADGPILAGVLHARVMQKACERRFRFSDPGYTRHQVPPRTSDIPPHSNPKGEDAASGSRWDSKAGSFSDWQRPSLLPWAQLLDLEVQAVVPTSGLLEDAKDGLH
jgi:hypothetical protein